jgi:hypothetical protein
MEIDLRPWIGARHLFPEPARPAISYDAAALI